MGTKTDPVTAAKCLVLAGITGEIMADTAARAPIPRGKRRRKYNNVPTVVDGIRYDSAKEARHGQLLAAMERDGLISELRRQVRFPLKVNGILVCTYVADFEYRDAERGRVVQDVKGYKTDVYRIKKALMKAVHGIEVIEV